MTDLEAPTLTPPTLLSLGSLESPLGQPHPDPRAPRFLLGLRCDCGKTLVVHAGALEDTQTLSCPHCQASLR